MEYDVANAPLFAQSNSMAPLCPSPVGKDWNWKFSVSPRYVLVLLSVLLPAHVGQLTAIRPVQFVA
jgi:hypothetical protein